MNLSGRDFLFYRVSMALHCSVFQQSTTGKFLQVSVLHVTVCPCYVISTGKRGVRVLIDWGFGVINVSSSQS